MRIAFVSDSIYPYNKGGKETRSYDLAVNLAKNHEVHFYTMKFWEGEDVIEKDGFYLHGVCKEYPLYINKRRSIKQGLVFGLSCFKIIGEEFDVLDADHMVYFHLFACRLACWLKRRKMVVTWNEVWGWKYWKEYLGWKGFIGYVLEKVCSKLPDRIISISEHTSKNLVEFGVDKKKIFTIDNSVDVSCIKGVKASKEKSDVIFAGRFLSHKNVDVLIKAVKDKKIKCVIVGDGEERENLEKFRFPCTRSVSHRI
ncbi:glycosyltransferase family 4 protein, partial [Nanoarchaeota archaeon]